MLNLIMQRLGNMQNFMSQFNQFRQGFQGNSQQQVQQLLNSGRMNQQQYNELYAAAKQIQSMFGIR